MVESSARSSQPLVPSLACHHRTQLAHRLPPLDRRSPTEQHEEHGHQQGSEQHGVDRLQPQHQRSSEQHAVAGRQRDRLHPVPGEFPLRQCLAGEQLVPCHRLAQQERHHADQERDGEVEVGKDRDVVRAQDVVIALPRVRDRPDDGNGDEDADEEEHEAGSGELAARASK